MADNTKAAGVLLIPEQDYTHVVDEAGVVQEHPVPKAWVGTPLLPEGWKAATKRQAADATDGGDES